MKISNWFKKGKNDGYSELENKEPPESSTVFADSLKGGDLNANVESDLESDEGKSDPGMLDVEASSSLEDGPEAV